MLQHHLHFTSKGWAIYAILSYLIPLKKYIEVQNELGNATMSKAAEVYM